jgi:hypothetical protein
MPPTQTLPAPAGTGTARRALVTDPGDVEDAAQALADGAVIGQAFANFYVMTSRADRPRVAAVNAMKGRPPDQVGSITTAPSRIPDVWSWQDLPARLSRRSVLGVVDTLFGLGPFGFRGPAAVHIPAHLTFPDAGVRTAQVIAPGYACPSNHFLVRATEAVDNDLLYITSANRSRHLTGADDTPAHWRAEGLQAEFGHVPDFRVLEHPDEAAARACYPRYLPMSTTLLAFHKLGDAPGDDRPQLVLERHGSMAEDDVRAVLDELGFGMVVSPQAQRRLMLRAYRDGGR